MVLSESQAKAAIKWNKKNSDRIGWDRNSVTVLLGFNMCIPEDSEQWVQRVAKFQKRNNLDVDGKIGNDTWRVLRYQELSDEDRVIALAVDRVAKFEGGYHYDRLNRDGEFRGLFDKVYMKRHGKPHRASNKIHIGLSAFIIQWSQDSGSLGKVLRAMLQKNPDKFKRIVGSTWFELMNVLEARGPSGFSTNKLRGPRVQKVPISVGGELKRYDIWEGPWIKVFKNLGRDPEFQAVQRKQAFEQFMADDLDYMRKHGLRSEKAMAIVFNRSVHFGNSRVDDLMERGLKKVEDFDGEYSLEREKKVLDIVSSYYSRAKDVLKDDGVSWDEWEGFRIF